MFITTEDETGATNATESPTLFERLRLVINMEPELVISGRLQDEQGVIRITAETSAGLPAQPSHNYH